MIIMSEYNNGYTLWNKIKIGVAGATIVGLALMYSLTGKENKPVFHTQKVAQEQIVQNSKPVQSRIEKPTADKQSKQGWIEIYNGVYSRPYTTNHQQAISDIISQLGIEDHLTTRDYLAGKTRVDKENQELMDRFDNMVYGGHVNNIQEYFKKSAYLNTLKDAGTSTQRRDMYIIMPKNMLKYAVKASMNLNNK
jgi:hypothetical protein